MLVEYSSIEYGNQDFPWADEHTPWGVKCITIDEGDPENIVKLKQAQDQRPVFVADQEALDTGYLLWVHFDEFGHILQRNRISVPDIMSNCGGHGDYFGPGHRAVGCQDGKVEFPEHFNGGAKAGGGARARAEEEAKSVERNKLGNEESGWTGWTPPGFEGKTSILDTSS